MAEIASKAPKVIPPTASSSLLAANNERFSSTPATTQTSRFGWGSSRKPADPPTNRHGDRK